MVYNDSRLALGISSAVIINIENDYCRRVSLTYGNHTYIEPGILWLRNLL